MQKRFKLLSLVSFLMIFMLFLTIPKTYAYVFNPSFPSDDDFTDYKDFEGWQGKYLPQYSIGDDIYMFTINEKLWNEGYSFSEVMERSFVFKQSTDFSDELQGYRIEDYSIHQDIFLHWDVTAQKWIIKPSNPVITGETAFVTNVDNPITVDEILSRVRAVDNEDGDITHLITIISDDYSANKNTLGTYLIKLSVTDSSNNTATLDISILVKDVTVPVITGTKTYTQSYTTKKDINTIISALSCTDNYDNVAPIIKVKTDNYTSNYNKVGTYTILFYATDSSGNEGTHTVTINVIDNVAPVFTGPTTILKGQSETLTIDTIKSQISVNDAVDGILTYTVKTDAYTGNGHKVGSYNIVFEATDKAGNISTHTITITVSDNIPPVFFVDNYFITVEQSINLTRQDIIDLLVASGQLVINSSTKVEFVLNEYEGNESNPGVYAISLKSSSSDGSSNLYSVAVLVEETNDGIILEPDLTFFQKVGKFFGSIWTWVKTPTVENGNFYKGYYLLIGFGAITAVYFSKKFFGKKRRW